MERLGKEGAGPMRGHCIGVEGVVRLGLEQGFSWIWGGKDEGIG